MRERRVPFASVIAAGLVFSAMAAAGPSSVERKVASLLSGPPPGNAAERAARAIALLDLGKAGLRELLDRLSPPGPADDTAVRYAVAGITAHVNRPGAPENDRSAWSRALLSALERRAETEIKAFLIDMLRAAGRNEAVKPLARFLSDDGLAGPAARALGTIGTPEAEAALLDSLKPPATGVTIAAIDALAAFRTRRASNGILPFARDPEAEVSRAALDALAAIGDPSAEPALAVIPVAATAGERIAAASRLLRYGRRLGEGGFGEDAVRIAGAVLGKFSAPGEGQVRSAALTVLVDIEGDGAMGPLLEASASPDAAFRGHALALADALPGPAVTARWVARIAEVPVEAGADIIAMLGRRGDASALPAVIEALKGPEPGIRLAAIPAAARLGGASVLQDLMPLFATASDAEAGALEGALSGFSAHDIVPQAGSVLPKASAPGRIALMRILAARRADSAADGVLAEALAEDPQVRLAALKALASVARRSDLPAILSLLRGTHSPAEILALQGALVTAASRSPEEEGRTALILEALADSDGDARIDLMRPLAKIGGPRALKAVLAETMSLDPRIKTVAVHTLAAWPDASAMDALLAIVRTSEERKHAHIALQGYVRLANASEDPSHKKLSTLLGALPMARTPDERSLVVAGLAHIRTPEAARAAAGFLSDSTLRSRAAESVARIAMPSSLEPGSTGRAAARLLKRAAAFLEDEGDREQVERRAAEILATDGFVPLFNGEDLLGWQGLVEDPVKRAKMSRGELAAAQRAADAEARAHWTAGNGVLSFDGQGRSLCTAREYGDLELFVDWRIGPGGDSGIYLRGSPQVQIWDPARGQEGSGGLYNNRTGPSRPLAAADHPVGSWNTFHIIMKGERVTVYLNDTLVVEDTVMENYWERDKPIYRAGAVELQAHATPLEFRDIFIKELPADGASPRPDRGGDR